MSTQLPLVVCLRPALRAAYVPRLRHQIRYVSTESQKPTSPASPPPPNSKPINNVVKPGLNPFDLTPTSSDPLEPAHSKLAEDHILKPLARPIGLKTIPQAGQNTGIDTRKFTEKRDDWLSYDRTLERRKQLWKESAKPYFRDWSRLQFSKGKIYLAPTRLIRADKALYFPNLTGITLKDNKKIQDTTPLAKGSITLVRIFTGLWAQRQVDTWLDDAEVKKVMDLGAGLVNRIDLNVEQNRMKSFMVRLFMPRLRKMMPTEMHDRYFLVRRGFEEEYKHALGMYNNAVGHVYLLDDECKIRWGGSGDAQDDERVGLRKGIIKLVEELQDKEKPKRKVSTKWQQASKFLAEVSKKP